MRPILTIGDPRLEQRCEPIPPSPGELSDLHATLNDFRLRRGFGRAIAAPQIGIAKRFIAMNLGAGPVSIINPEITWRSDDLFEVWDDCLSIPDRVIRVRRNTSITLHYTDEAGRLRHWRELPPDLSELLQHEIDHLDGILMTERAYGPDPVRPISEHAALVGAGRPKSRLLLENILRASETIDPAFRNTPHYDLELFGCHVRMKDETANPIRCFKGRGADFFLSPGTEPIVCASAGNWGLALAYVGRKLGRKVVVYASVNASPFKLQRIRELGAEVRLAGDDFDGAKAVACLQPGFVEDGRDAAITEGAGSIAVELLAGNPAFDAVLLPLGNGALLNGCARWIKAASPATRVIGVCAAGADSMRQSFLERRVVERDSAVTIADGIAVRVPVAEAVADMLMLVDEVRLVTDEQIRQAMSLIPVRVEPCGAVGIAALLGGAFQGQSVATVLTGGNLPNSEKEE